MSWNSCIHCDHYFKRPFLLKYKFYINKEKGLSIAPQGLVRFVQNSPFQYDGNINFDWQDKFWIGATYKSDYAVGANVGFCIHKQLYVGYSYDFIIGDIGEYSGMAHELMLNFKFGKNKKEEVAELPKEDNKLNEEAAKRMDSLETELNINQVKLKALSDKVDQLSKQQAQAPVNTSNQNQNAQVGENSANKRVEDGVLIVTNQKTEFTDEDGFKPLSAYAKNAVAQVLPALCVVNRGERGIKSLACGHLGQSLVPLRLVCGANRTRMREVSKGPNNDRDSEDKRPRAHNELLAFTIHFV